MKSLSPRKNQTMKDQFTSNYTPYVRDNDSRKSGFLTSQSNVIYDEKTKRKLEVSQITLQKQSFHKFLQAHQWRSKTSLPIVKSYYLNKIDEHTDTVSIEVYNQYIPFRLNQLSNIPFTQGIYMLKESLIAFERLLEKFGSFYPSDKMIGINENSKCHVWLNENFSENKFILDQIQEQEFCLVILSMIQDRINQNQISTDIWQKFKANPTFLGILKQIQTFQNQNGIKLPNKVQIILLDSEESPQITHTKIIKERKSSMGKSFNSSFKKKKSIPYQSQQTRVFQQNQINFGEEKTLGVTNASDCIISSPKNDKKNINKTSQTIWSYSPSKSPKTPLRHFKSNLKVKLSTMFRSSEVEDMFLKASPKRQRIRKFSVKDEQHFYDPENPQKRRRRYQQQQDIMDPNEKLKFKQFLMNNGWEKNIRDLLSTKNVRDSIIQGGDTVPQRLITCEKLDVFANNMFVSSLIPDEQ